MTLNGKLPAFCIPQPRQHKQMFFACQGSSRRSQYSVLVRTLPITRLTGHLASEVLGAVSQEIQAERNQPCRESCYPSCESSTNSPTVDARRLQTEGLLHQPIDFSRMRRDV